VEKKTIKEHHSIRFVIGVDKYKYKKLIQGMKNNVLRKNDTFPKDHIRGRPCTIQIENQLGFKYNGISYESN